jgi:hypothetical protein
MTLFSALIVCLRLWLITPLIARMPPRGAAKVAMKSNGEWRAQQMIETSHAISS